jgi:excisionase family DNA binding protein
MSDGIARVLVDIPRVALTRKEAAASLGVGLTFFEEQVQPELKVIRRGAKVLIPLTELERWTTENAERVLAPVGRERGR